MLSHIHLSCVEAHGCLVHTAVHPLHEGQQVTPRMELHGQIQAGTILNVEGAF
jgi:hypothetical protein